MGLEKVVVYTMLVVEVHLPAGKLIEYVPQPKPLPLTNCLRFAKEWTIEPRGTGCLYAPVSDCMRSRWFTCTMKTPFVVYVYVEMDQVQG